MPKMGSKTELPVWFKDIQSIQNKIDDDRDSLGISRVKAGARFEGVGGTTQEFRE